MAVDYNNTVLHVGANIAYEEGENKEENQTAYNDKVVHADVTINEYTKPGAGNIDEGSGNGSSNLYDLTETSFDFQNPTIGRLFVRYTNMTNFPDDNFLRNAVYNGDDNEYIDAVATSAASCILECTKVTDSSGNVVYFLTVSRCVPSVAPAENKLARCYGYGKPTTKGSSTTITWAFRQDYW